MKSRRKLLSLCILGLSILLILSEILFHFLEEKRQDINKARHLFLNSVNLSQSQIAGALKELSQDPIFLSKLNGTQTYSLTKYLENKVHPGTFDFLTLYNSSCEKISKTKFSSISKSDCESSSLEKWLSFSYGDQSILSIKKKILRYGKVYYLEGGKILDKEWAKSHPELFPSLEKAVLSWGPSTTEKHCFLNILCKNSSETLWSLGTHLQSNLSLNSNTFYFSFFKNRLLKDEPSTNTLSIFLLFSIILLLFFYYSQKSLESYNFRKDLKNFLRWSREPSKALENPIKLKWMRTSQKKLYSFYKSQEERIRDLEKSENALQEEIISLNKLLSQKEREVSNNIPNTILSEYISSSGSQIIRNLESCVESEKDLKSIIEQSLIPHNLLLLERLNFWKKGIEKRGERFFIKSLYEEDTPTGENLLKHDIHSFFKRTEFLNSTLYQLLNLTKNSANIEQKSLNTLNSWKELSQKVQLSGSKRIQDIAESALALLKAHSQEPLEVLCSFSPKTTLDLPAPTMLSVFFLIFRSLLKVPKNLPKSSYIFQMHRRVKEDSFVLAISLTNEKGEVLKSYPSESSLLDIQKILKTWKVLCQLIQKPEEGTYILLTGSKRLFVDKSLSLNF